MCRLILPLMQAAQNIVPIAVTAAEAVNKLRTWASGRCLNADQMRIYRYTTSRLHHNVAQDKIDPMQNGRPKLLSLPVVPMPQGTRFCGHFFLTSASHRRFGFPSKLTCALAPTEKKPGFSAGLCCFVFFRVFL